MASGKKLVVVLSVVAAGASVAHFFGRDVTQFNLWQPDLSNNPFDEHVSRRAPGSATPRLFPEPPPTTQALRVPPAATIPQPKGSGDTQVVYHKSVNPVGALLEPIEGIVDDADELEIRDDKPAPILPPAGLADEQRHTVRDGDTLTRLAARYLGKSEAYLEIYEANRDVLRSPDLLPIGAVLRIPRRQSPARPLTSTQTEVTHPLKMVPVSAGPGG